MTIREIRILPPLAIARLGSAPESVVNYTIDDNPDQPLEFRELIPQPTLVIDEEKGEISRSYVPTEVTFKDERQRIRPVAPFLEVFARTETNQLVPLTLDVLRTAGLGPEAVSWKARVANRKAARRTGNERDVVTASTGWFSHHRLQRLEGHCPHFVSESAFIDFGHVRYIHPNPGFPQIRLRFTPAKGLIYGPNNPPPPSPEYDPLLEADTPYEVPPERRLYDTKKGGWCGFMVPAGIDNADPDYHGRFVNETMPPSLFASVPPAPPWLHGNIAVSRGYLDDACDGIVEVKLKLADGTELAASARVTAAPPMLVPDSLFLRNLADDLDQVIHGPAVPPNEPEEVTRARALDIVRRAFETVRFLNIAVMNGNPVNGRDPLNFDTMPAEEAFDTERLMRPVVTEGAADTLAILRLHQHVFAALRGGAAPWFADVLRRPDEVADFTDHGRRKMPAMMCGADGNYLALTWRQIATIVRASQLPLRSTPPDQAGKAVADPLHPGPLTPRNLSAQVHYAAAGNPVSSRPVTSVSNCTPGLEVDFRAVWRRVFIGIELREWDNLVVRMEPGYADQKLPDLSGHRLLRVNGHLMMTQAVGPSPADVGGQSVVLATDANPFGIAPLEWSNSLAHILRDHVGKTVKCDFTAEPVWTRPARWSGRKGSFITFTLQVRPFFEPGTAVISPVLAKPGELTQGLCSPWQNDYRECSCYYWASARPDFVNVEPTPSGTSRGDNWMQKERTGEYVADDYVDKRLLHYDDLFADWESALKFQIGGRDAFEPPMDQAAGHADVAAPVPPTPSARAAKAGPSPRRPRPGKKAVAARRRKR